MLNYEEFNVTGIVDKRVSENNALIKVLAISDYDGKLYTDNFMEMFPPSGCIFGPSFFAKNTIISEGNIIDFKCQENEKYTGSGVITKYIVTDGSVSKTDHIKTYPVDRLPLYDRYAEIEAINERLIDSNTIFCISDGKKIMGKLRLLANNSIEPVVKKRVYVWDRSCCNIIFDGRFEYIKIPDKGLCAYDCMGDVKLFEWFRDKLRKINPEYVKFLDEQTKWRKDFPKYFDESDKESLELEKYRLNRIKGKFSGIELSIHEIESLLKTSKTFKNIFSESIKNHISSFRSEYEKKLIECKKRYEIEKSEFENSLKEIKDQIKVKEAQLEALQKNVTDYKTDLEYISKNKKRILSDFSIIRDVLTPLSPMGNIHTQDTNRFLSLMETVEPKKNSPEITKKNECIDRIKYFLKDYNLNPSMASNLLNVILSFQGVIIENIAYGIVFAKALGNTKYIIQQAEPDWLRFKQFWENGLSEIWYSSHESPDITHLFLLEDLNLASPECYARPLIDVLKGIRGRLPYANSKVPKNLKILATRISFEDPQIGLPLYQSTFEGWGIFGFGKKNIDEEVIKPSFTDGYLTSHTMEKFVPGEFEKRNICKDMEIDYKELFFC